MTRVRADLFVSLDGYQPDDPSPDDPMGADWPRLTAAWTATRTFRERVLGGAGGSTGLDDAHARAFLDGIGAEIMGAGMFGLHAFPDDPDWTGWWGDRPPFGTPVYVLTHTAPRPPVTMEGGTTFHFRAASLQDVLVEAREAAAGRDVRVGGGFSTAHAFLRAGLVDRLHVMVAPVVLGRGHRLWEDLRGLELTHAVTSEVADSGTVHVTFDRVASAPAETG